VRVALRPVRSLFTCLDWDPERLQAASQMSQLRTSSSAASHSYRVDSGRIGVSSFRAMGNSFAPNGFSIGSSRHVSSSKYPKSYCMKVRSQMRSPTCVTPMSARPDARRLCHRTRALARASICPAVRQATPMPSASGRRSSKRRPSGWCGEATGRIRTRHGNRTCAAVRCDGAVALDKATRHTILLDNPARLYEFAEV
jgi:hypothetical protein